MQIVSPSENAACIASSIMAQFMDGSATEDSIRNMCRFLVRGTLEYCARIAEDYVALEDPEESLRGCEVGDQIAADIREIADERRLSEYPVSQPRRAEDAGMAK